MTALTDYECGVLITRGPQDWEIIQQENGAAEVIVSGVFKLTQITGNEKVYARVVHEGTREEVVPYTQCFVEGHEWFIKLKVPAGGLYMLETVLNNDEEKPLSHSVRGDVRKHFGVGDVYLIAGQSNAVGYGKEPVNDPPELGVHCLYARGKWELAVHPLADATETLHPVNREHMNPGI